MIIKIKNLKLKTIMGVYDFEQNIARKIIINAIIETNARKSLISDDINDTIDYDHIVEKIKNVIKNNHFKLIEKMANSVMSAIMEDQRIKKCQLEIDKVGAVKDVESFSIMLTEERN